MDKGRKALVFLYILIHIFAFVFLFVKYLISIPLGIQVTMAR